MISGKKIDRGNGTALQNDRRSRGTAASSSFEKLNGPFPIVSSFRSKHFDYVYFWDRRDNERC